MSNTTQKRRQYYTVEQKKAILDNLDREGISISLLSRRHGIHPVTLYSWRRQMKQKINQEMKKESKEVEELRKENETLKKVVSELSVEKYILETANKILKRDQKKELLKSQKRPLKS